MSERSKRYESWRALKKQIRKADIYDPKIADLQLLFHESIIGALVPPILTRAHAIQAIRVLNYLVVACAPYEMPIRRALLHLAKFIQSG